MHKSASAIKSTRLLEKGWPKKTYRKQEEIKSKNVESDGLPHVTTYKIYCSFSGKFSRNRQDNWKFTIGIVLVFLLYKAFN